VVLWLVGVCCVWGGGGGVGGWGVRGVGVCSSVAGGLGVCVCASLSLWLSHSLFLR